MSTNLVGDIPSKWLGVLVDILQKMRSGHITLEHAERFAKLDSTPFAVVAKDAKREIEKFAAKTARRLSAVFKKRILVDPPPPEFTEENITRWATFNLEPVFLPGEDIGRERKLKGWTKLADWCYSRVEDGKIKPIAEDLPPTMLRRGWYLADFTVSVDYTNGSQVFVDDPLAPIIAKLREEKKIGKYDNTSMGSRFSITWDEWVNPLLTYVASAYGLPRAQVRLERAIEFNAIGNLYDANRGKFNAWEWFYDQFEDSRRLCGGCRDVGGLAGVSYDSQMGRDSILASRPLVSFVR